MYFTSDRGSSDTVSDKDIEIEGFDFATLRKNNPNLSTELTSFRNHLTDGSTEISPMKQWQLQDLSFQVFIYQELFIRALPFFKFLYEVALNIEH